MVSVPFDPLEGRLCLQRSSLFDLRQDVLHQIFVFYRFPRRSLPPIPSPVDIPHRHTVDRVLAVRDDAHVSIFGHHIQSAEDGCEFSPLVRLPWTGENLGKVPVQPILASSRSGCRAPSLPVVSWSKVDADPRKRPSIAVAQCTAIRVDS